MKKIVPFLFAGVSWGFARLGSFETHEGLVFWYAAASAISAFGVFYSAAWIAGVFKEMT